MSRSWRSGFFEWFWVVFGERIYIWKEMLIEIFFDDFGFIDFSNILEYYLDIWIVVIIKDV